VGLVDRLQAEWPVIEKAPLIRGPRLRILEHPVRLSPLVGEGVRRSL